MSRNGDPQTWRLEPRDPLVLGNGTPAPALAPRSNFWLPPQGTLAGFVRSQFVAGRSAVSADSAKALLEVRIRGPWLAEWPPETEAAPRLWWPVPADVAVVKPEKNGPREPRFERGRLIELGPGEGVSWPPGLDQELTPILLPARVDGRKTSRPSFPFWPWSTVVDWSLGVEVKAQGEAAGLERLPGDQQALKAPVVDEHRVHVAMQRAPVGTAVPEALFSSGGRRFGCGYGIACEVEDRRSVDGLQALRAGESPRVGVLGAESRATRYRVLDGGCFPAFDAELRRRYRACIDEILGRGEPLGLRLQLLTPAWFGGWRPGWIDQWPEEWSRDSALEPLRRLSLTAACIGPYQAVSGWSLQPQGRGRGADRARRRPPGGGPRAVRRLVPAGSVYLFGEMGKDDGGELLALCEAFWGRSLCAGQDGDPDAFLAPPINDGYGLALPAPCSLATFR